MSDLMKKILFWVVVVWAVLATVFAVIMFVRGKVEYTKNEYITSNSISNSFAHSGSVAIGYVGELKGKWDNTVLIAHDVDELLTMLKSLSPAEFAFAKPMVVPEGVLGPRPVFLIIFPDVATVKIERKGELKTKYEERRNVK